MSFLSNRKHVHSEISTASGAELRANQMHENVGDLSEVHMSTAFNLNNKVHDSKVVSMERLHPYLGSHLLLKVRTNEVKSPKPRAKSR